MKIIYQRPFEDLNIPKPDKSELWDIYVSKSGSTFIFDGSIWFVLFDTNFRKDVAEDLISLLRDNKGLYKDIIEDLKLINFHRFKEIEEDLFFKSFLNNLKIIWNHYEQGTASTTN